MEESMAKNMLAFKEGNETLLNEQTELESNIVVNELPSEFKGYPEGTKVSFKPITLEELEVLNSDNMDTERAIALLLKSIHCTTLPAQDLYYWDVIYVGIKRKLLAFGGTKGTLSRRCPYCGATVSKTFAYTDLEFKPIEARALPIRLDIAGEQLVFSELTMKEFLQIKTEQGELGVYARMIKNKPFEEALALVKGATGVDIKKLRFVDKQLDYGLKPFYVDCKHEIQNPDFISDVETPQVPKKIKCGNRVALEVRSPFEIVFPEDEIDGYNDFEVQYG